MENINNKNQTRTGKMFHLQPKAEKPLSDDDILKLFLGFVRLIKKTALFEAEIKLQEKLSLYTAKLKKATADLKAARLELEAAKSGLAENN